MSWAPEVIADNSGKFCGNGLRFATRAEAEANVLALAMRWTSVRDTRVVESPDPVNYAWIDGHLVRLEETPR
jgi:prepilin-type processing-associated H-X9-DG protein